MRSLSGGLLAAQQSDNATPYIVVAAVLGAGVWYFTTENDFLYSIEHTEEPYGTEAVIRLKNKDHFFDGKNLTGFQIGIGYGYSSEWSFAPPMWVYAQDDVSVEGQLLTELTCIDIFQKMSWHAMGADVETGRPGAPVGWRRDLTIRQIITMVLAQMDPSVTLVVDSSDGIENTFKPSYQTQINQKVRSIIRDMMVMTKCGLRMDSSKVMHLLYLDPGAGPVYTYDTAHAHFSNIRQKGLTIPNWIMYVDHFPSDESDTSQFFGEAKDLESINRIGSVPVAMAPPENQGIQSDAEAQQMAESILHRLKVEAHQGRIVVPHNCGQELYDPIQVQDSRSGMTFAGRVGGLIHRYTCGEATGEGEHSYTLEIRLGGLVEAVTTTHPDRLISDLRSLSLIHDLGMVGKSGGLGISDLPRGLQNWSSDLIFYPGNFGGTNKHNAVHWSAGTILWPDGRIVSVNAGQVTNITFGHQLYIYWDLTVADPQNLRWTYDLGETIHPYRGLLASVSATLPGGIVTIYTHGPGVQEVGGLPPGVVVTESLVDAAITAAKLGNNSVVTAAIAQNAIDTGHLKNLVVTTDKMKDAVITKEKLQDQAVTHEKIVSDAIYGRLIAAEAIATEHLAVGAVSADKMAANAVIAEVIASGTILADILLVNTIRGGYILADSVTADKLRINTLAEISKGVMGTLHTGVIRPKYFGSVVWDGGIYFRRQDGLTGWGWVGDVGTGKMEVRSSGSIPLLLACGSGGAVFSAPGDQWGPMSDGDQYWWFRTFNIAGTTIRDHRFAPRVPWHGYCGDQSYPWMVMATYALYTATVQYFQDEDDIALVKGIRGMKVDRYRDSGGVVHPDRPAHGESKKVEATVIDVESLPSAVRAPKSRPGDKDMVDLGALSGLTLGAMKQIITRLERVEKRLGMRKSDEDR